MTCGSAATRAARWSCTLAAPPIHPVFSPKPAEPTTRAAPGLSNLTLRLRASATCSVRPLTIICALVLRTRNAQSWPDLRTIQPTTRTASAARLHAKRHSLPIALRVRFHACNRRLRATSLPLERNTLSRARTELRPQGSRGAAGARVRGARHYHDRGRSFGGRGLLRERPGIC